MDTDVLSSMRKERKHPAVQAWTLATPESDLFTTVISVAEIQCGIERQMPHQPEYAIATQRWLDGFLATSADRVLGLGLEAALILARMHETAALRNFILPDRRQSKQRRSPADLAIAAIAIAENATVVTGNQRHFEQINKHFPLPGLYNSFSDEWSVPSARGTG